MRDNENESKWQHYKDFTDPDTDLTVRVNRIETDGKPPLHSLQVGRLNADTGRFSKHVHLLTRRVNNTMDFRADYSAIISKLLASATAAILKDVQDWRLRF